jgi:hypothetical protein
VVIRRRAGFLYLVFLKKVCLFKEKDAFVSALPLGCCKFAPQSIVRVWFPTASRADMVRSKASKTKNK